MRDWGIDPHLMCDTHLLGEHREMHAVFGSIKKGRSIKGHLNPDDVQINPIGIYDRHSELEHELIVERGFNCPAPFFSYPDFLDIIIKNVPHGSRETKIDSKANLIDLLSGCPGCRHQYYKVKGRFPKGIKLESNRNANYVHLESHYYVHKRVMNYIDKHIKPIYDTFDGAHTSDHMYNVIRWAARGHMLHRVDTGDFSIRPEVVVMAAAMHDVGLEYGRKFHHQHSSQAVLNNSFINKFFEQNEVDLIAAACLRHRHTIGVKFSLVDKLISDADRSDILNLNKLYLRCITFRKDKLNDPEIIDDIIDHLKSKWTRVKFASDSFKKHYDGARLVHVDVLNKQSDSIRNILNRMIRNYGRKTVYDSISEKAGTIEI